MAKEPKSLVIAETAGVLIATHMESASPNEGILFEETMTVVFTQLTPDRSKENKAYDSDKLDQHPINERGIVLILQHR